MKKRAIICLLLTTITMSLVIPVEAKEVTNSLISTGNLVQISDCAGQNAILGNVNDPDSVAWLLQKLLDYARVIGPFLVLILSIVLNSFQGYFSLKMNHRNIIVNL